MGNKSRLTIDDKKELNNYKSPKNRLKWGKALAKTHFFVLAFADDQF